MMLRMASLHNRAWCLTAALFIAGPVALCLGALKPGDPQVGPHACCNPEDGECVRFSGYRACEEGWNDQGNYSDCLGLGACMFSDGTCEEVDDQCCDDMGGVSNGVGSFCGACQLPSGACAEISLADCDAAGGTPLGAGTECAELGACCLIDFSAGRGGDGPPVNCLIRDRDVCYNELAGFPGVPGTDCSDLSDTDQPWSDDVPNVCDNCPLYPHYVHDQAYDCNGDQDTTDPTETPVDRNGDGIPDPVQCDTDLDGHGNWCDNCEDDANGNWAGPNDQFDCDGDGIGDVCDTDPPDCDGDGFADPCEGSDGDNDTDGDGVTDDVDVCDFTPGNAIGEVFQAEGHRLRGTIYGDLDGDCDRDQADLDLLDLLGTTEASCNDGVASFEAFCPAP